MSIIPAIIHTVASRQQKGGDAPRTPRAGFGDWLLASAIIMLLAWFAWRLW